MEPDKVKVNNSVYVKLEKREKADKVQGNQ